MENIKIIITKIVCVLLSVAIIFCVSSIFLGCTGNNTYEGDLLRLHIRANSNDKADQSVKLKVRDEINAYISDNITKSTFDEAYSEIGERLDIISQIADNTLRANGYCYGATAKLSYEYFPSRMYKDVTVPEGFYDALIVELGSGKGDNWWCVIYPPLCYGEDFKYKSFFAELFG